MSITELWMGLTGRTGQLTKILKALEELKRGQGAIERRLDQIIKGDTPWQVDVTARLDRIEEAVIGGEAATLIVTVGEPTEQE